MLTATTNYGGCRKRWFNNRSSLVWKRELSLISAKHPFWTIHPQSPHNLLRLLPAFPLLPPPSDPHFESEWVETVCWPSLGSAKGQLLGDNGDNGDMLFSSRAAPLYRFYRTPVGIYRWEKKVVSFSGTSLPKFVEHLVMDNAFVRILSLKTGQSKKIWSVMSESRERCQSRQPLITMSEKTKRFHFSQTLF